MAAFDFKKFISGFNLLQGDKVGKLMFYAVLITIGGFIIWSAFIKPTKHDVQNVSQRMDFHGARIDSLVLQTHRDEVKEVKRHWSVGTYVEARADDWSDITTGLRVDYLF